MKMRKLIAILLVAVLCFAAVSCGDKGNGDATTDTASVSGTPAGDSSAPAGDSSAPAGDSSAPAGDSSAPADDSSAPADDSSAPADDSSAPADESTAPVAPVDPANAVVKVNETLYENMEDAIDALVAGDTLTLLKDFSTDCGFYPYVDGEYTIDGDGHTITADIANDGLFNLMGGVLTMKNIKIIYTETTSSDGAKGAIIVNSDCTATLEDVDISSKCNDVLLIKSKGILNINSGKYVIEDGNSVPYSNVIDAQGSSVVVINNGEFYRNDKGLTSVRAMVRLDKGANITINNGYFFSATGRIIFSNGNSNKTFTINGGEFEIGTNGAYTDPMFVLNQKITGTINGGTFTINSGSVDANGVATPMFNLGVKTANITITGGTFNNAEGNLLYVMSGIFKTGGGSFVNSLGKVIGFADDDKYVEADTVIEFYAGTIAYSANDDAAVLKGYVPSASKVTDSGASLIITGVLPVETEPEAQPAA